MSDEALYELADAAGISADWTDATGQPERVAPDTLRAVLAALGIDAAGDGAVADSLRRVREDAGRPAAMATAETGRDALLGRGGLSGRARLHLEDGGTSDVTLTETGDGWVLPAVETAGYHRLECGDHEITVAVAPASGVRVDELAPGSRLWALAVQIYGLGGPEQAFGTFGDLGGFAEDAAASGAHAVAISPVHALFAADPQRYSPYAPSTRLFLNVLYGDPAAVFDRDYLAQFGAAPATPAGGDGLIDWPRAGAGRVEWLRTIFDRFRKTPPDGMRSVFDRFRREGGTLLESHARFEALHSHFRLKADAADWLSWPEPYRDCRSPDVERFAASAREEVAFHAFLQWLASASLDAAHRRSKDAGMAVGLIADLAVGMDRGGSHGWSRPDELLMGLSIGAPPDLLGPQGQDWGLTGFSPRGLAENGFAPFLETLRAAMRHAGGVRIDHAMSMQRLWVIPTGADPRAGAYLRYPLTDLLRLVALESSRHRALVIGEDLGTVPEGFREKIAAAGILGMRVLFFERDDEGRFTPPGAYPVNAAALTTTHDLATVAGWWQGREIGWRRQVGWLDESGEQTQRGERDDERTKLWQAFREAGVGEGDQPPPHETDRVADAACRFVGETPAPLAIVPVEDIAGLVEQPNLPGTTDEHPNWRRRLPADILEGEQAKARMKTITAAREAR